MATVTIASNNYEVFAGVAAADAFLAGDVSRAGAWATRNDDAKKRGLISATRMLVTLPWAVPPDINVPPTALVEVTAMLASDLLTKPRLFADASANSNVKSVKAGSASVEFFQPKADSPPIPLAMWRMLNLAGLLAEDAEVTVTSVNAGPFFGGQDGGCAAPGAVWDRPPYWTDPNGRDC